MRLAFLLFTITSLAAAQDPPHPVAIVDARIVIDPAHTLEKGTIVLRDRLILAVGTDVTAPPEAEMIDGKGLTVYAGFIDGSTNLGLSSIKRSEEERKIAEGQAADFKRSALAGMESANRKGIRPELRVAELVAPSEGDLKKWRAAGFTVAAVAVPDEYWAGQGALVVLSGTPRRDSLLAVQTGLTASLASYGEGYPTTTMGVLAHLRQSISDARHYRDLHARYVEAPSGSRPPYDPSLEALAEMLDKKVPLFIHVDSDTAILRALALAKAGDFRPVIVSGIEAYKVIPELKAAGASVILSLKWPKEPEDKKKHVDDIEEDRPAKLLAHEKQEWEDRVRCAIKLHEAGIPMAFSSLDLPPGDVLEQVHKLVERGLPRATALAALTTTPAVLYLVDRQVGRLTPGSCANLTVLTGELGDKKAKVKYVFADGVKFEIDRKKSAPPEIGIAGTWTCTAKGFEATLEIKQSGADLTGTLKTTKGEGAITGKVYGQNFDLTASIASATYQFTGTLQEKKLKGTFAGPEGTDIDWSATKPER